MSSCVQVADTVGEVNLIWHSGSLTPTDCRALRPYQRINRFPLSSELARKDLIVLALRRLAHAVPSVKLASFFPDTFLLPRERRSFVAVCKDDPDALWIVKPSASSQGRGIRIVTQASDVAHDAECVVSRYLHRPLLVDGYKVGRCVPISCSSIPSCSVHSQWIVVV